MVCDASAALEAFLFAILRKSVHGPIDRRQRPDNVAAQSNSSRMLEEEVVILVLLKIL
jgi:hypothetical protein